MLTDLGCAVIKPATASARRSIFARQTVDAASSISMSAASSFVPWRRACAAGSYIFATDTRRRPDHAASPPAGLAEAFLQAISAGHAGEPDGGPATPRLVRMGGGRLVEGPLC
jgi:hypothetical protein